jgi:hypothetical protein
LSARKSLVAGTAIAVVLALTLGGCTYDYLQRTDRVAYSAGNAVKANLESQTTDPSSESAYKTKGLGRNGVVVGPGAAPE